MEIDEAYDLIRVAGDGFSYLLSMQELCVPTIIERRWWVRPIISKRHEKGFLQNFIREIKYDDPEWFFEYTRMELNQFEWILRKVSPYLEKRHLLREPIPPELKLFVTLRYLSAGNSMFTLASEYRIGVSTVRRIIPEVCKVLWDVLYQDAFPELTAEYWLSVSSHFNFPHACGAIDGKHIRIKAPEHSGSLNYNYKGFFSTVLLGVADSMCRFLYVSIGALGSNSDGGVLRDSRLGHLLENDALNFPAPEPLVPGDTPIPYFFLGDEAFGLKHWCMVPYSGTHLDDNCRKFNYRLASNRSKIENAFGILASKWRIFNGTISAAQEQVDHFVKATIILHNLLIGSRSHMYKKKFRSAATENNYYSEILKNSAIRDLAGNSESIPTHEASVIRHYLKEFISNVF
ncbi:uncharacterized protein DMENIID0001_096690 [Sergentomyia squamirostris]